VISFGQVEEKDPYYSFLQLHLTKEHGAARKWKVREMETFLMGVPLKAQESTPSKMSPTVPSPFPCLFMLFCEMPLKKAIVRILLFYLIKKESHSGAMCALEGRGGTWSKVVVTSYCLVRQTAMPAPAVSTLEEEAKSRTGPTRVEHRMRGLQGRVLIRSLCLCGAILAF
jgi:hypothetical protein